MQYQLNLYLTGAVVTLYLYQRREASLNKECQLMSVVVHIYHLSFIMTARLFAATFHAIKDYLLSVLFISN
jgi:hypothetical protein